MLKLNEEMNRAVTADEITTSYLYELQYAPDQYLRWVAGNRELSYNGEIYTSAAIKHSEISQDTEGKISDIQLQVGNVDRVIQYYINKYELIGKNVKITQVFFGKAKLPVVVDNTDEGCVESTGTWVISSHPEHYGSSSFYSNDGTFTWKARVDGKQDVGVWYCHAPNRSKTAEYKVFSNGVLLGTHVVNQEEGGGKWVRLGTYEFDRQAEIELSGANGSEEFLSADAVKFYGANGSEKIIGDLTHTFAIKSVTAKKDIANITLSIGLDALKLELPNRKIFSKSCSWQFKDKTCRYSGSETTCAKTFADCRRKGNTLNFGGFPGVINERLYF